MALSPLRGCCVVGLRLKDELRMGITIHPGRRRRRRGLRLPPALLAAIAVCCIAVAAMGQVRDAAAPATQSAVASGASGADGAAPTTAPAKTIRPSLWELFQKGGPVMWVLAVCS